MSRSRLVLFFLTPLLLLTGRSPCMAQTQTTVKVDGTEYTIISQMRGRMFQIITPDGRTAMIMPTASGYNIVSPPNGIYEGIDYKPQIAKIWQAYQDQKGGTSMTTAPAASPDAERNDPNAARRAQVDALTARTQARLNAIQNRGDEKPVFKAFTETGAIVTHPKFGDVKVIDNGMKYEWTVNPIDPRTGEKGVPSVYTVSFEGGENEAGAGAKTGKVLKGIGTGIANGINRSANCLKRHHGEGRCVERQAKAWERHTNRF